MSFINASNQRYVTNPRGELTFEAAFGGSLSPQVYSPSVAGAADFQAVFAGEFRPQVGGSRRLNFRVQSAGEIIPRVRLYLEEPEPILNEISPTAFQNQKLKARLLVNGVETKYKSFNYQKPRGASGASLSVEMARADLSLLPEGASFTFQIGKKVAGVYEWHPLIENAALDSRSYALAYLNDRLSFSTVAPLDDKLSLCPRSNCVYYGGGSSEIDSAQASRPELEEPLYDNLGNQIKTKFVYKSVLSLYFLFNEAFVKGCGFDSFETNIPNFEVSRCELSITSSYLDSVAPLIGVFEPVFFAVGNVLWILDKTAAIPDDFTPNAISPARFTSFQSSQPSRAPLDGYVLEFVQSSSEANYYTTRIEQLPTEETGQFGDDNFTQTDTTRTYKEWRHTDNPDVILKSALISEVRETRDGVTLIGRDTETHTFDAAGKRKSSRRVIEALVPDLANAGNPSLLTVRDEVQQIYYKTDSRNIRRLLQDRQVTQTRGLIATDAENPYFGADFKQDFLEAHKAGNLNVDMTSSFGAIKTVTESLLTLGGGQVQIKVNTVDHVRGTTVNSISEIKTGDVGLNASVPKQRKLVVWREGVDLTAKRGARLAAFNAGDLPFRFALPLVERKLARETDQPDNASIEILGFDESCERGVFFAVEGRGGADLGIYLTEGLNVSGAYGAPITTTIDAGQI
ncbi:MAG TPA: hypothetical protein VF599_12360 [Pyrinomonadaceae bacterium]|jgi:hypothetical protein